MAPTVSRHPQSIFPFETPKERLRQAVGLSTSLGRVILFQWHRGLPLLHHH